MENILAVMNQTINRTENDVAGIDREWLYSQFAPLVRRLIIQYGTCPHLRDELVGEIYYRFCALLKAYDPDRGVPLRPYLVRQLSASVYTYVRSYRHGAARELPFEPSLEEVHRDLRADPTKEWDHTMALESIQEIIPKALSHLSERQQKVMLWRYYHDCSFEEIAQRLGIQTSTARSLLRHGLNNMRKWFITQEMSLD